MTVALFFQRSKIAVSSLPCASLLHGTQAVSIDGTTKRRKAVSRRCGSAIENRRLGHFCSSDCARCVLQFGTTKNKKNVSWLTHLSANTKTCSQLRPPLCSEAINCMLKSPLSFTSSQGLVCTVTISGQEYKDGQFYKTPRRQEPNSCASSWNQPTSPHVKTDAREMLDDHHCAPQVTTPLVV
jgi:hypothetical protein